MGPVRRDDTLILQCAGRISSLRHDCCEGSPRGHLNLDGHSAPLLVPIPGLVPCERNITNQGRGCRTPQSANCTPPHPNRRPACPIMFNQTGDLHCQYAIPTFMRALSRRPSAVGWPFK